MAFSQSMYIRTHIDNCIYSLERRAYTNMKEYLIWCGEKIEAATGWPWCKCMAVCTCGKYRWLFDGPDAELSISNYLKEVER